MAITPLPPPPRRGEAPADFANKGNALLGSLPQFVTEANDLASDVNDKQQSTAVAAQAAAESAALAVSSSTQAEQSALQSQQSAGEAEGFRDAAQFFAEEAGGKWDIPALTDNAGNVLTVNDDGTGFDWRRSTIAVALSVQSPDETATGYDWTISTHGESRQVDGSISQFIVQWWDGALSSHTPAQGEADISRQVDLGQGETVTATVWAHDDLGNRSEGVSVSALVVGNRPPAGPITIDAPTQVSRGAEFQVAFTGATDPDGDPITYEITDSGSFVFVKTEGIIAAEIVTGTAPPVEEDTPITIKVRARDNKGGTSAEYSKTITVQAAQIIGVALRATGNGGTFEHIDENGDPIDTPTASWFNNHPVFGGINDVLVDGQHMVEVPKFHYRRGTAGGDAAWWISDQLMAGFEVMPAFVLGEAEVDAFQVGKYQASLSAGKLQSLPGVLPVVNRSLTQFLADGQARNVSGVEGFRLWHYDMWLAIQWLYLIEHASMDSQATTGQGRVSASSAANVDATDVAEATYRGIVGLWGNVYQWLDGVRTNASAIQRRSYTAAGWTSTGQSVPNSGGVHYPITLRSTDDEQFVAATFSGSNTAAATIPDYVRWRDGGEYYPLVGGNWNQGADAGLWYVHCNISATYTTSTFGARLARVI